MGEDCDLEVEQWRELGAFVRTKRAVMDAERLRDWGFEVEFEGLRGLAIVGGRGG